MENSPLEGHLVPTASRGCSRNTTRGLEVFVALRSWQLHPLDHRIPPQQTHESHLLKLCNTYKLTTWGEFPSKPLAHWILENNGLEVFTCTLVHSTAF